MGIYFTGLVPFLMPPHRRLFSYSLVQTQKEKMFCLQTTVTAFFEGGGLFVFCPATPFHPVTICPNKNKSFSYTMMSLL
jgi:hypothetical protein